MKRSEENNTMLYVALGVAALLLVAAVVSMKLLLHPVPRAPSVAAEAQEPAAALVQAPALYQEEVRADALRYGLGDLSLGTLAAPLRHTVELAAPRMLHPGESVETPTLRLTARSESREAQGERGNFRADHLLLLIENLSDQPVAYRVETRFEHPERCEGRGLLLHNAIALPPHGHVERSECFYRPGLAFTVTRAETVTLTPLGYYYVSQLVPAQIGLDARTAAGHAPPRPVTTCNLPFWREFAMWGLEWADLVDFFARHDCQKYAPYKEYRFRRTAGPLPARPYSPSSGALPEGG